MRDLTSPKAMVFKAMLFLVLAGTCGFGLWLQAPRFLTLVLAIVLAWAAARVYYFLFYVLHAYVDPSLRYSGLLSLTRQLTAWSSKRKTRRRRPHPSVRRR